MFSANRHAGHRENPPGEDHGARWRPADPLGEKLRAKLPGLARSVTRLPGVGPNPRAQAPRRAGHSPRSRRAARPRRAGSCATSRASGRSSRSRCSRPSRPRHRRSRARAFLPLSQGPADRRRDPRGAARAPGRRPRRARRLPARRGRSVQGRRHRRHRAGPVGARAPRWPIDIVQSAGSAGERRHAGQTDSGVASTCGSSRPTSSATCSSTHRLQGSTTWRCASARSAAACTSPSTGSSRTRPARPCAAPPRRRSTSALGSPWIPPELREGRGELAAAATVRCPT